MDSFYIRNFRLFKETSIENLGQINLITGKNNSGKSCFLEALYLYAQSASPFVMDQLISNRAEDWEFRRKQKYGRWQQLESPFRHLFYGHQLPKLGENPIELGSFKQENKRLKVHISAYQSITDNGKRIVTRIDKSQVNGNLDNFDLVVEAEEDAQFRIIIYLKRSPDEQFSTDFLFEKHPEKFPVQYLPTGQSNPEDISILWDNINVKPRLRNEVFRGLRLIDEDIQEIVKIDSDEDAVFVLIYGNPDKRLPLGSTGNGMSHLFHIILALVNAKDGILLIDEFENGLHYEIQPKLWSLIFQLAEQLNVQVFATTHSRDTIYALKQAATSLGKKEQTRFIKLKSLRKAGMIKATELDFEELDSLLEQDIEVR